MKMRRFIEPCPARRGEFHDWHFDWQAKQVYPGPQKRHVTEYCTFCGLHVDYIEDRPDIEPVRPDVGPFYKGLPPRVA